MLSQICSDLSGSVRKTPCHFLVLFPNKQLSSEPGQHHGEQELKHSNSFIMENSNLGKLSHSHGNKTHITKTSKFIRRKVKFRESLEGWSLEGKALSPSSAQHGQHKCSEICVYIWFAALTGCRKSPLKALL